MRFYDSVVTHTHGAFNAAAGVYDISIELNHWPHLEDHCKKSITSNLVVSDIMTPNPVVLREVERVSTIIDVLRGTRHNGFPVLYSSQTLESNPRLGSLAGVCPSVAI